MIIAQILIYGMMAFLMIGFFAILHLGLTSSMLVVWIRSFVIAWPVAFGFSFIVSPVAFMIACRLVLNRAPAAG